MSKYVKKNHGLTIGSDNMFFVIDRGDDNEPELVLPEKGVKDFRDGYMAIVTIRGYYFDQCNTVNVFIRSPAEQLILKQETLEWEEPWEYEGKTGILPRSQTYNVMTGWATRWLNTNVGARYDKWDTYTRGKRNDGCIFFKRRKDALAFTKAVDDMLAGMHFR
jgi:hypothetical protein